METILWTFEIKNKCVYGNNNFIIVMAYLIWSKISRVYRTKYIAKLKNYNIFF